MGISAQRDLTSHPLVIGGRCVVRRVTVAQIALRSTDVAAGTVMALAASTNKWEPWTDNTATDGTAHPCGILLDTLTAATIAAGDMTSVNMVVGDALINEDLITYEGSRAKTDVVNIPANFNKTGEQCLRMFGIELIDTIEATSYEA